MSGQSSLATKAQLDKSEREHLEDVVTNLRKTVEKDIEYQLEHSYELNSEDGGKGLSDEEAATRAELVTAVEREDGDKSWEVKFERYVMGVGYTIVNRLTALRCMEVRGFIDRPVTQFGDSGTTPAAERLETEEFLGPNEAIIEAYDRECEKLSEEIEILFDSDSPYSIIDPDVDIFEELCLALDDVPEELWRADDVLGWVYEYYNTPKLQEVRKKARQGKLEADDVPAANQFYTPHWVVRQLTDNSLGKMYLESKDEFHSTVDQQSHLSMSERKNRTPHIQDSPSVSDYCTYLIPSETDQDVTNFKNIEEIRVIDPACGSGHFLLYAFDVLERIWRAETEIPPEEIPRKILRYNLFGIDLDMRACQLAAFNLYLKARTRTEAEGKSSFEMPNIGIVCADARIVNFDDARELFEEVSGEKDELYKALESLIDQFEDVHGIGGLLDVRGTLSEQFLETQSDTLQTTFEDDWDADLTLQSFLNTLQDAIDKRINGDSFAAQDLKSFVRLLSVLAQDYDVALMNPPYGSAQRGRMPQTVKSYVEDHYDYAPQYYLNFFEACDQILKDDGRIGMLVPRSFMFKRRYQDFREDFIGDRGSFDFLAEFGEGILDNAIVRTVGTVVRTGGTGNEQGDFFRLHDIPTEQKEEVFINTAFELDTSEDVQRHYRLPLENFKKIPGSPLSYWTPHEIREYHDTNLKLDPEAAKIDGDAVCSVKTGIQTGKNPRFVRRHWEVDELNEFIPYAKGGEEAWISPHIDRCINWSSDGAEVERYKGSKIYNEGFFKNEGLTWTYSKETGRRFGYYPSGGIFDIKGSMIFTQDLSSWILMSALNSTLYHGIFLSLTPERDWGVSDVGRIPWYTEFEEEVDLLEDASISQYDVSITSSESDPTSPFYVAPSVYPGNREYFYNHIYTEGSSPQDRELSSDMSLSQLSKSAKITKLNREQTLEESASEIDDLMFSVAGVSESTKEQLLQEIALRTSEDPRDRKPDKVENVEVTEQEVRADIKELIHHLVLEIVSETEDGIVPIQASSDIKTVLDELEIKFQEIFGDYAEERLAEADQLLGDLPAGDSPYPNLDQWISDNLFNYHVGKFENTPIVWKLSTNDLVSNPATEGFACILDYQRLDSSVFDRLETKYLEPEKSELNERRNAAERRSNNESLSTSERAEASEEYERCESALTQINELQEAMMQLSSPHVPDRDPQVETIAADLKPKVVRFRERTVERLETLDELVEEMDPEKFDEVFSPKFLQRVNENREDWIEALKMLETACTEYSKGPKHPVETHLYDLFVYVDDIIGSTYHGSNDITFMNHYFSKGKSYLEDGRPRDGLDNDIHLLAELAAETDEDVELGREVKDECNKLSKILPSDWKTRAKSEILTAGYNPVKKYGVEANIQPLAEKNIVPEIVEDKVL